VIKYSKEEIILKIVTLILNSTLLKVDFIRR